MTVDPQIVNENAKSLQLLEDVAGRPELLSRDLGDGWTVAMALAHLAFWDRRVVRLIERWEHDGRRPDDVDDDLMNESLLDEWRALEPEAAARLALEAAREVNRAVESISGRVAEEAMASGWERLLQRDLHRHEHLREIELS